MKTKMAFLTRLTCLIGLITIILFAPDTSAQARRGAGQGRRPATHRPAKRPATKPRQGGANRVGTSGRGKNNKVGGNGNRGGGSNRNNVNIHVDNRHVNVHNHRPGYVRPPMRPYHRPPYIYGGRRYFAFHPYFYHPFRPFYWGPIWHPWGFLVTSLAVTAIVVSIENQKYHYDQGVFYEPSGNGYKVVQAPVGAVVPSVPDNSEHVVINETTNNYYYGGTYYEKSGDGYKVVEPTAGTTVEHLPEGAEEVSIGDQKYVKYGETYYQPVQIDGKNQYEVSTVEDDDSPKP